MHGAGLDEESIMQLAGLKGASKHESAADENTHFTPATNKGRFRGVGCEEFSTELMICTTAVSLQ